MNFRYTFFRFVFPLTALGFLIFWLAVCYVSPAKQNKYVSFLSKWNRRMFKR